VPGGGAGAWVANWVAEGGACGAGGAYWIGAAQARGGES